MTWHLPRLMLSLAYIAVLPMALCATFAPGTRVTVSPQLGMSPLVVQVRAVIDAPMPDWYCPELTVRWQDGTESKRESDCAPWEGLIQTPYYSETVWKRLGPGEHWITVTLRQGAKSQQFPLKVEVAE